MMVGKKELIYFPGFGFHFMIDDHIKLARNWEEDKQTISNQIDRINNGVIFIFPEGTRFEPKKRDEGQKYAEENNLPNYDYLLVPKSKGFWTFYNLLKEKNKMGKIYDMTIVMQNFVGETAYLNDLTSKETGNIFIINRELKHPELYLENSDFKNWLLNEWKIKDDLIKMYQKLVYKKMEIKDNQKNIQLSIILIFVLSWLFIQKKEFRYYMLVSLILSMLIVKFKKL
jgi:1-acyl-sn-glycerol-3-phosphate acyltransferase